MICFFEDFNERGFDRDIAQLLKLAGSKEDDPAHSNLWQDWITSIEKTLHAPLGTVPEECQFRFIHKK